MQGAAVYGLLFPYLTKIPIQLRFEEFFTSQDFQSGQETMESPHIQLKLFAALTPLLPENADHLPIRPGISVGELLEDLNIPLVKAHLIFINGVKQSLESRLAGGERVGVFPPVAGG